MSAEKQTCASCKSIGVSYWDNGFTISHHCLKESTRRKEQMPKGADFLDHFRAFFDASADQAACKHYEERPLLDAASLAVLESMGKTGRVDLKFWSDESQLANKLAGKFLKQDYHAECAKGFRVFRILPVGEHERSRAAASKAKEAA